MTSRAWTMLLAAGLGSGCSYDWSVDHAADAGAPVSDSSADAEADADAAFTCDGALFCDTFDGASLAQNWMDTFNAAGGILRIEAFAPAPSGNNVLHAARPAQTSDPSTAYATQVVSQSVVRGLLSFQVRPEQLDSDSSVCIAGIVFDDGTANEHLVRVFVSNGKAFLQEKTQGFVDHVLSGAPAIDQWSTMTIAVEVGGRIVVRLNDAVILDMPTDASWSSSTSTRIFLGIDFEQQPSGPTSLRFDDVRFDGS